MRPPHRTAALVLTGWYLMWPPMSESFHVELNAPIARWMVMKSFDSADSCERYNQYVAAHAKALASAKPEARAAALLAMKSGHCIATDDPRLKEK
jgi:hypothetical protein